MNRIIDFSMVLLLPLLMAYSLIGEVFHEIAGTVMLILFIIHLILHRKWWKAVPKGKYTAYRTVTTVLNIVLLVLMIMQPLSGIAMSHHLYTFLPFTGIAWAARDIHLFLGYWSYVLMDIHLGFHIALILRGLRKGEEGKPVFAGKVFTALMFAASPYGIYAFIKRGFPGYMLRQTMFAYFDFGEPLLFFILDYLAIMALFAAAGYSAGKLLKSK